MAQAGGACTGSQDMSIASKLNEDIPTCMQESQTASGIAACIEKDGFTAGCADCVGTYGACIIDKCASQCEADPTGSACKSCYTDKCMPAFLSCSGFPSPSHLEKAQGGACLSPTDMQNAENLKTDIPACMRQSQTASGIASCIENDGFTAGCASCVGTYGACVIDNCLSQCESAPDGQACKSCYTSKCSPAFDSCTGFPSQQSQQLALAKPFVAQNHLIIRMLRAE